MRRAEKGRGERMESFYLRARLVDRIEKGDTSCKTRGRLLLLGTTSSRGTQL